MKYLFNIAMAAAALCAATACTHSGETAGTGDIDRIEAAYARGSYATAQAMADSMVIGPEFSSLDTDELCRLSLILMNLGENSAEPEVNTAFAARCFSAALSRDSDSTAIFIRNVSNEDRARLMMLNSLNEASHTAPLEEDSLYYED